MWQRCGYFLVKIWKEGIRHLKDLNLKNVDFTIIHMYFAQNENNALHLLIASMNRGNDCNKKNMSMFIFGDLNIFLNIGVVLFIVNLFYML